MPSPSAASRIPVAVATVVGEVLASYYDDETLNALFGEHGAPGEPPAGNRVQRCERWLRRCNDDSGVDPLAVLGGVLEWYMETDPSRLASHGIVRPIKEALELGTGRAAVNRVLARYGLRYVTGGRVVAAAKPGVVTSATQSLRDALRARDLEALEAEVARALATVEADPPAALTAACALVEAFCKVYIEDHLGELTLPSDQSVKPLWALVQRHLGLDPAAVTTGTPAGVADADLKRILGGLASVVDGLGAFRTHAGSAHGRGRTRYRVAPRDARLTVNAAHALVLFAIETWDARAAAPAVAGRQVA